MNISEAPNRKRATAVIVKNGAVLLIQRIKPGHEYFVFPGGGVEEGESIENALVREVKEELSLDVIRHRFLFSVQNIRMPSFASAHTQFQDEYYFLIEEYRGTLDLGGPEKERRSKDNQYHFVWLPIRTLGEQSNILPEGDAKKLADFLSGSGAGGAIS